MIKITLIMLIISVVLFVCVWVWFQLLSVERYFMYRIDPPMKVVIPICAVVLFWGATFIMFIISALTLVMRIG